MVIKRELEYEWRRKRRGVSSLQLNRLTPVVTRLSVTRHNEVNHLIRTLSPASRPKRRDSRDVVSVVTRRTLPHTRDFCVSKGTHLVVKEHITPSWFYISSDKSTFTVRSKRFFELVVI